MTEYISTSTETDMENDELEEMKRLKEEVEEDLRQLREWRREHKDMVNQANKEWRAKNKDIVREMNRRYYHENKDYFTEKIKCEKCGCQVQRQSMPKHLKAKKCQIFSLT